MLTVKKLRRKPKHFHNFITGLTPKHFDELLAALEALYEQAEEERLENPNPVYYVPQAPHATLTYRAARAAAHELDVLQALLHNPEDLARLSLRPRL